MSLVNTQYWREEAIRFAKEGTYCRFPKGSYQYREYWEEQTKRCMEGYSVGGVHISGVYYYYLNFYPILGKDEKTNKKTRIFPRVTDVDFEFFTELENAKKESKGFILVKPRRTGFSFKNSALLTHEYNFYREAQCWIGAFQSDLAETTFNMGLQGLNFLNENTAWKKNRDPDTKEYVKSRIKIKTDEGDIWKGYNSSIGRLTFKDNPFAAIGKCLAEGTKVLMYNGQFKNVEDVKVGDLLMGVDSTPRTVLSTTSGVDDMYEVQQLRGQNYVVNSQHKLYLEQRCNTKSVSSDGIKILTPEEFLKLPQYKQNYTHGIKCNLIEFEKKEVPLDSYFVGLWLGDGSSAKTSVTNIDEEIINYLNDFAESKNLKCSKYKESYTISQKGKIKKGNIVRNVFKDLNLFNNKHVPDIYKINSSEERLKLVAGLIDSDGYKINNKYCEITQKNKKLAEDIIFILRSLGFYAKISKKISTINGKNCAEVYRIHFTGPLYKIPTLIKRKQFEKEVFKTDYKKTPIKIKPLGKGNYYGFTLDKDHLFILEDFTITHNSANIFIFEEAGRWPGLIQSYNITEPCWRDGADMIGMPVIFGTGGDMQGGTEEFAEMFYNPDKYNLKAFDNIWDDDVATSKSGWFFPAYKMRFGTYKDAFREHPDWKGVEMVDTEGNSILDVAKQDILDFRRIKEQGVDQKAKQDAITQYPFTPKEAFLSNVLSRFPVGHLKAVRAKLTDEELNKHQIGKLVFKDGNLVFEDTQTETPFREYPVKAPREGCIEMYEVPKPSEDGSFNIKRYIAGIDPYNYDVSKSESVGCILIYDRVTQRIVAEYSGKPEKTEKFYEICRRLLIFYEATALYEANLTALYHYFEKKKCLNLLEDTPTNLRDRNVWKPGTNTSKGIIATKQVNEKGLEFIENWLKAPISETSEDLNMNTLRSVGLLEELIKWEPDPRKNFDRISAFSMVMWFDQTLTEYAEQQNAAKNAKSKFGKHFNKFKKNPLENDYDQYFKIETE